MIVHAKEFAVIVLNIIAGREKYRVVFLAESERTYDCSNECFAELVQTGEDII